MSHNTPTIGPILKVSNLTVDYPGKKTGTRIISGLNISLERGETLGIVGESGCGKSLLAKTIVRLESPAKLISGSILLDGQDISKADSRDIKNLRGRKISLVLQNPKGSMDPVFTIGSQFRDTLAIDPDSNSSANRAAQDSKIYQFLKDVSIASPEERLRQYPHQWSRGMLQRAQLQMAFSTRPEIVIMDEITSALDPAVTTRIIRLLSEYKKQHGTSIIFITHDLSIAMAICDRIAVMHKGEIIEHGKAGEIIKNPSRTYTIKLVSGMSVETAETHEKPGNTTLLSIQNMSVKFSLENGGIFRKRSFYAVKNADIEIKHKEIFCLIGESGSGKSTLMNGILGFSPYKEGKIIFDNRQVTHHGDRVHQMLIKRSQAVFQDPVASLNPYLTLKQSILEPLHGKKCSKKERDAIALKLASETGLPESLLARKPGNASVGQNQRACIARAPFY